MPYALANLTQQPTGGNPLLKHAAPDGALGMDMKYALTPGLTFTGTINPDFGQVEADPAVVNLTAFETFFSERRPFFVEGSGNFNFSMDCNDGACTGLFYTPPHRPRAAGRSTICRATTTSTPTRRRRPRFSAPAKLTGRVGKYSIGVHAGVHAGRDRARADRRGAVAAGGRAGDELHRRPRPPRVREPVVDRRRW